MRPVQTSLATCWHKSSTLCLTREDMCLPREDKASETATVCGKGGHCHGQNAADNPRRQHQRGRAHVPNIKEGVRMRVDGWAYLNHIIARNSEEHRFGKNLLLYILLHWPAPGPECMQKMMHVNLFSKPPPCIATPEAGAPASCTSSGTNTVCTHACYILKRKKERTATKPRVDNTME